MRLVDAYVQATRTILDEFSEDDGRQDVLQRVMRHAVSAFERFDRGPDQKELDLVLISSLEKRSECVDAVDRVTIIHDRSLARDMQILNAVYDPDLKDNVIHHYVCRSLLHQAMSEGYLNLAYQVLLDGRGYDMSFERSLPSCPVTFLHEIYTLYHEAGHYTIARSDVAREARDSMIEMMRHQDYFGHAKRHLAIGEQAVLYSELIDNDADLHEEVFCDHFAYRYGFFWLKHATTSVNPQLDYRLHPPLMGMFLSNLFLLEHVRFGFKLAVARIRGENSDDVFGAMEASLARYRIGNFFVTMMDAGVFAAGPFGLDEARAMRPFSAGLSEKVSHIQATEFSQIGLKVANRALFYFSLDPLATIVPEDRLDRRFGETIDAFDDRERILGLLRSGPEALQAEFGKPFRRGARSPAAPPSGDGASGLWASLRRKIGGRG